MRAGFAGAASLVAVALIAASCGGTQAVGTGASDIVPSSAPVFIQVDTDPGSSRWQTVNDLASRFPDKQKAVDAIKKDLRKQGDLDWNDDVKPALGKELDVIWLDFRNGGTDAVALTQPGDEQKFAEVIRKGNAHDPSAQLVYEKFADWEVISDSRAKIQRFEEQSKSASSTLGDDPNFGHAMDKLGDAVVRAYVSGPQVMREALNAAGRQGRPVIRKLGSLDWAAAALGATSSGVALNLIAHGTPGKLLKGFDAASYRSHLATTTVPKDALLYYTFHGWGSAKGIAPIFGAAQLGPLRSLLAQVGKLIAGENALYVRPAASGRIPEITLVTEPARGTNGAVGLDHFLHRFRKELHAAPRRTEIAGLPARTLSFGSFAINYANVGSKLVVTDLPAGIRGVQSGPKLAQNANYRDTLESAGIPSKTPGYLYVNIHSTIPLVEHLSHARIPSEIRRNLSPLRSALEYEVARSHEVEVSFFLRIK